MSDGYVRRFVADLPDAAVAVDVDGRIIAANALVTALLGHPTSALVGHHVELLVPDTVRDRHAGWRQAFQSRPTTRAMGGGMLLHARRADGDELPVEVSLAPLGAGITVAILHDRADTVRARSALEDRLAAEDVAVAIASHLAGVTGQDLEHGLDTGIEDLCRLVGAEVGLLYATDGDHLRLTNEWWLEELDGRPGRVERLPRHPFGWAGAILRRGEAVFLADVAEAPPAASAEASFMDAHGIRSALRIPLGGPDEYEGALSLRWHRAPSSWDPAQVDLVRLIGNVFLAAHRRRQAEAVKDASELRHRLLVDTLAAGIVLIRRDDARIVGANPAAARILGIERNDLVGIDVRGPAVMLLDAHGRELSDAERHELLWPERDTGTRELGVRHASGAVVWLEVRAVALELDERSHLAVSFCNRRSSSMSPRRAA